MESKMRKYRVYSVGLGNFEIEAPDDIHAAVLGTKGCIEVGTDVDSIFNIDDKWCPVCIYDCSDYCGDDCEDDNGDDNGG
jgi:hypothetical protein